MKKRIIKLILILCGVLLCGNVFADVVNSSEDKLFLAENSTEETLSAEEFVKNYVLLRATLLSDIDEMEARWLDGGDLQKMSLEKVYDVFLEKTGKPMLNRMREDNMTGDVKILSVNQINDTIWQVNYEVDYNFPNQKAPITKKMRATIMIQQNLPTEQQTEKLENSVGFKVKNYATQELINAF